jgi:hypothetical protein
MELLRRDRRIIEQSIVCIADASPRIVRETKVAGEPAAVTWFPVPDIFSYVSFL